jgi:hypothetical protein
MRMAKLLHHAEWGDRALGYMHRSGMSLMTTLQCALTELNEQDLASLKADPLQMQSGNNLLSCILA